MAQNTKNTKNTKKEVKEFKEEVRIQFDEDFIVESKKTMFSLGLATNQQRDVICLNNLEEDMLKRRYLLNCYIPGSEERGTQTTWTKLVVTGKFLKAFKDKFGFKLSEKCNKPFKPSFKIREWYDREHQQQRYIFEIHNLALWDKEKKSWQYLYESNKENDEQSKSGASTMKTQEIDDSELPF